MAFRKRTQKQVAKRHDLDYFKKGSPIRSWQGYGALIAVVAAALWLGLASARSATVYTAGPISSPHAAFGKQCELCHVPAMRVAGWLPVIGSRRNVPDSACESCHNVSGHHPRVSTQGVTCSSCHVEHLGATHLAAAPVAACTQCHAQLETSGRAPLVAANIHSFTNGHPEFRPFREASAEVKDAAFGLKFNHAVHLGGALAVAGGGSEKLACESCHVATAGGTKGSGMARVDFDQSCRRCHSLDFDRRVKQQAPHADSATVLHFVQAQMAVAAPGDTQALVAAETIVYRERCALCHTVTGATVLPRAIETHLELPSIAPAHQPDRIFTSAVFSHAAHNPVGCTECHENVATSTSGKDLIMPGIATCKRCHDGWSDPQHAPPSGHAESGCSLCHGFHEGDPLAPKPARFTRSIGELTASNQGRF